MPNKRISKMDTPITKKSSVFLQPTINFPGLKETEIPKRFSFGGTENKLLQARSKVSGFIFYKNRESISKLIF